MNLPTIAINELYDNVTYQGEGLDIGRPCFFIRTHNCPVKCPGCDTHFTWDGSEKGDKKTFDQLREWALTKYKNFPGAGFVISGGEPLLHYKNEYFVNFIRELSFLTWTNLETSGFVGPQPAEHVQLRNFLQSFSRVSLSPKITPCLHGEGWTDKELEVNIPSFLASLVPTLTPHRHHALVLKFVVRDEFDMMAVVDSDNRHNFTKSSVPVMIMPFGIHAEEVIETSKRLLPFTAKHGYILSPRLHTLFWDAKRGV